MKTGSGARRRGWAETSALALLLLVIVGFLSSISLVHEWQVRVADSFFRLAPPPKNSSRVVVVSIDDRSLQQYGRWPWSRELLARLTNNLVQAGAGPIGLDILLSEAQSPESDSELANAFRASDGVVIVDKLANFPEGPRWVEPISALSQWAAVGHAHAVLDADSICRRFPALELTLDGPRRAFAIEVAHRTDPKRTSDFLAAYGLRYGEHTSAISVAKPILVPIAFRSDGIQTLSASEVLSGIDPAVVRGRPVLVGFGPTEIGDRLSTPLSRELPAPGVEVHAQILDSILTGRMLRDIPFWGSGFILLMTAIAAIAAFRVRRGAASIGVLAVIALLVYGIGFSALMFFSRIMPVGEMLLAVGLAPLLVYTADSVEVERSLTQQLRSLRKWLSVRGREVPIKQSGDLSWRLQLLQDLQTELGSLYELHKALLESTQDLVATFDHNDHLLLTNEAFRSAFDVAANSSFTLGELRSKLDPNPDAQPVVTNAVEEGEVFVQNQLYGLRVVPLPATTLAPGGGTIVTLTNLRTRVERDRARAEALGFITHELRTPLSSIHGFAEMMMRDPEVALAERAGETIYRETKRLLALISSYLDVLRMDAGAKPLAVHIIDVESLVNQVFDIVQPLASAAGMNLVVDIHEPITLLGDAPLITGAILNLVSNAIKYGQPGSDIRVCCSQHPDEVIIRVQNAGQAIAQDEIPRLFDPYYRAANVENSKTGWGLGLAFVKRIVEKHGGSIEVSTVPGGIVFGMHLPAQADPFTISEKGRHETSSAD